MLETKGARPIVTRGFSVTFKIILNCFKAIRMSPQGAFYLVICLFTAKLSAEANLFSQEAITKQEPLSSLPY